uniref:Uncharacterized protein n=1 Tax=Corynecladia elata TaxID=3101723 RepID=A0AA51NFR8_9FLOR|nr:hypothetical protein RU988_pgp153 [Laurencia elata]WMP12641.1 hypothetical protein [Laurencia elata]
MCYMMSSLFKLRNYYFFKYLSKVLSTIIVVLTIVILVFSFGNFKKKKAMNFL